MLMLKHVQVKIVSRKCLNKTQMCTPHYHLRLISEDQFIYNVKADEQSSGLSYLQKIKILW